MSDLMKMTGLWMKTSKNGRQYLQGRLGQLRILIMENSRRKTDEEPTHELLCRPVSSRGQESPTPPPHGYGTPQEVANDENIHAHF